MKIKDYISIGNPIKAIDILLNEGKMKYSIGLQLHITHPSYEGKISLDALTKLFLTAIEQTITHESTSLAKRAEAIMIWEDLEELYLERSFWIDSFKPIKLFHQIFPSKKDYSKIILNTNYENRKQNLLIFSETALGSTLPLKIQAIKNNSSDGKLYVADQEDLLYKSGYGVNVYIITPNDLLPLA